MTREKVDMLNQGFAQNSASVPGRVYIADLESCVEFSLRPSESAMIEIQRLEEASLTAEQRLGNFRIG
jgi:hypothetical protein